MAKFRHIAFVCENAEATAQFLHDAFDLEILYHTPGPGEAYVLSDGDINFTLLTKDFQRHDAAAWHFGLEMSMEELDRRRRKLEEMGVDVNEGVRDGRPVEAFCRTPEGQRIDMAPFWPTKKGQTRRQEEYRAWKKDAAKA